MWFQADLRAYKRAPGPTRRAALRGARSDRILRRRTGVVARARPLARLHARQDEPLLRVLERPEIPLPTDGTGNDLRGHVIEREISGGTQSEAGRTARGAPLGRPQTCRELGVASFAHRGDRLDVPGAPAIAPLPDLVRARVPVRPPPLWPRLPEYRDLARDMAAALCRQRPSPVASGRPRTWACAIVYELGRVNFLSDPATRPAMTLAQVCAAFGVGQSTASAKARAISKLLDVNRLNPSWLLPSLVEAHPLVWLAEVNGVLVDLRGMPSEVQRIAFEKGTIPYIPADRE